MVVLVIDNRRYLINEESKGSDKVCEDLIKFARPNAIIEFDVVKKQDVI